MTVTSTFKTSVNCQQAVNRARRILFQLQRGFAVLTPEIFRPLYLALVRPILEYGQQASSPYLQRDIALMERKQRLVTRMIKGMREPPYELPFSTDALTSRKLSFSRPQQNEIYEDITSR